MVLRRWHFAYVMGLWEYLEYLQCMTNIYLEQNLLTEYIMYSELSLEEIQCDITSMEKLDWMI